MGGSYLPTYPSGKLKIYRDYAPIYHEKRILYYIMGRNLKFKL